MASVGLGELYDPGAIPIKLKAKKEEPEGDEKSKDTSSSAGGVGPSGGLLSLGGTEKPQWSARGWSKPGTSSRSTVTPEPTGSAAKDDHLRSEGSDHSVKAEDLALPDSIFNEPVKTLSEETPPATVKTEEITPSVKSESTDLDKPQPATSGGSLFKKRKVPVAGAVEAADGCDLRPVYIIVCISHCAIAKERPPNEDPPPVEVVFLLTIIPDSDRQDGRGILTSHSRYERRDRAVQREETTQGINRT